MNLLFIGSRNQWRSKTAETLFKGRLGRNVQSAGTAASAKRKVSASLIAWADIIYVMEKRHKEIMTTKFELETADKQFIV